MSTKRTVYAIIIVACLAATALPGSVASGHAGIHQGFRIDNGSAGPARPFEAFDAVNIAAVDLTGDGRKEILAHNDNNRFYVFGADGRLLAELDTPHPNGWNARELAGPAVGDVNGNGLTDVVLTNSAGWVVAFEAQPTGDDRRVRFVKLWENYLDPHHEDPDYSSTMPYGKWTGTPGMDAPAYMADTNGDGRDESFVQLDDVPGLYKLGPGGGAQWWDFVSDGNGGPLVADLTGDGRLEALFPSDGGQIRIYDASSMRHRCTFHAQGYGAWPASISVTPTAADLTGDGRREVVFGVRDVADDRSDPDWIHRSHAHYFAVNADCGVVWHKTWTWGNPHVYMQPVPVDVNGDGRLDVVFQDWNTVGHKPGNWEHTGPANLFAVDGASGGLLWRVETPNYWSNKNVAVADVTGDGRTEILASEVQSGDGLGLFGLDGSRRGFVSAPNGWVVTRGPSVVDLDNDGRLDIILPVHRSASNCDRNLDVGCREGALQVYRTSSYAKPVYSNVHLLNAGSAPAPSPDPTPDPDGGSGDLSFSNVRGNEWWVELDVHGAASVALRVDGGDWRGMDRTDWGSWARSLHVPSGSVVQFWAEDSGGAEKTSSCYAWPGGSPTTCPSSTPPPPDPGSGGSGDLSFSNPRGNEWWVEVDVGGGTVVSAALRVDGGQWTGMDRTDWGSWARSMHANSGSVVQFWAEDSGGDTGTSGCYTWPDATPTTCPGGSGGSGSLDASFVEVRGNEWWVETDVRTSASLSGVDARVSGGTWQPLQATDWGSWARSIHAPPGSSVEFRARATDGSTAESQSFTWPPS